MPIKSAENQLKSGQKDRDVLLWYSVYNPFRCFVLLTVCAVNSNIGDGRELCLERPPKNFVDISMPSKTAQYDTHNGENIL